jgi:hypothetical protein
MSALVASLVRNNVVMWMDYEDGEQLREFRRAYKEGRQPMCVYCNEPLSTIEETQGVVLRWTWDKERRTYVKSELDGWSDKPYCGNCEVKDWEFTNNGYVEY